MQAGYQERHSDVSPDYQESYPSTVLLLNCHGVALFMDGLQSDVVVSFFNIRSFDQSEVGSCVLEDNHGLSKRYEVL
jgi:hypothetical protein